VNAKTKIVFSAKTLRLRHILVFQEQTHHGIKQDSSRQTHSSGYSPTKFQISNKQSLFCALVTGERQALDLIFNF
jgi:hypothetical protein